MKSAAKNSGAAQITNTLSVCRETDRRLVEVPQVQEIGFRNRIVEVPEIHVKERIQPRIRVQEVVRKVPRIKHVLREKRVEIPRVEIIDKEVYVPFVQEVVRYVPKPEIREVEKHVHAEVVRYEEKIIEVPRTEYVDTYLEVPQVKPVVKYVEKVHVMELNVEVIKHVPIKEIRKIEKIRFVPGPIQYCDITYDKPVTHEVYDIIEKIVEVPVEEEITVEKCVTRPVKGPVIEVPIETIKYVDRVRYEEVPGRVIIKEVPFDVEQIEEIQIPEYHEVEKIVAREKIVHVERLHEVEVPEYVEEVLEVPEYVYFQEAPQIIIPKRVEKSMDLPDIYETAEPRFVHDVVEYLPPVYDAPLDPIVRDETMYMPAESVLSAPDGSSVDPTSSQSWLQPAVVMGNRDAPPLSQQPRVRNFPAAFPSFPSSAVYAVPSTAAFHKPSSAALGLLNSPKGVTDINSRIERTLTDTSILSTFSNVWKAAERFGSIASSKGHAQACEKFKSANG
eukprot:Lankesteria_metandrocarpae@DN7075_c0_g1_i1.p1